MKQFTILILSVILFGSAGLAFEQQDLDQMPSQEQLFDHGNFDMEGLSAGGLDELEQFFGQRRFKCVSKNRRGRRFVAEAGERRRARRRAMRKCRRNSRRPRSCYIARCKRRGGKLGDLIDLIDQF